MTRHQRMYIDKPLPASKNRMIPKRDLLVVVEAMNKVGAKVEEFFAAALHAVRAPQWFVPEREAERFTHVRATLREKKPYEKLKYRVPACVLAFAKMISNMAATRARKFLNELQARAIMSPAPRPAFLA